VANQRRWDSHMTHVRTNDRCSGLTSAPRKGGGSLVLGMHSGLVGPLTEHVPPTTSTARSSSRTSKRPEFFLVGADAFGSFHRERCSYSCDSNLQTMAESFTSQKTSGTPSSGTRGNFQIPPSSYIHSLDLWSRGDPSWG